MIYPCLKWIPIQSKVNLQRPQTPSRRRQQRVFASALRVSGEGCLEGPEQLGTTRQLADAESLKVKAMEIY